MTQDHPQERDLGKVTLEQIAALGLRLTPENYALWHCYLGGTHGELNNCVNEMFDKGDHITERSSRDLYQRYILSKERTNSGNGLGDRFKKLADRLVHSTHFRLTLSNDLKSYVRRLHRLVEAEDIALEAEFLATELSQLCLDIVESDLDVMSLTADMNTQVEGLRQYVDTVRNVSLIDGLTNLGGRKLFDREMERLIEESRKYETSLCLILMDLDHFKQINDDHGHVVGDQVLRLVALVIKRTAKSSDVSARYGGEEFAIILPNTSLEEAIEVANSIRENAAKRKLVDKTGGGTLDKVTISGGVALLRDDDTSESLIQRADRGLYQSKGDGRNQITSEEDLRDDGEAKAQEKAQEKGQEKGQDKVEDKDKAEPKPLLSEGSGS